jgi:hypothetical protein
MDMGHYQVAAMLQAAATSLVTHGLYAATLPKTDAALAEMLAALQPGLAAAGLDASLLSALRHARARGRRRHGRLPTRRCCTCAGCAAR